MVYVGGIPLRVPVREFTVPTDGRKTRPYKTKIKIVK